MNRFVRRRRPGEGVKETDFLQKHSIHKHTKGVKRSSDWLKRNNLSQSLDGYNFTLGKQLKYMTKGEWYEMKRSDV